MMVCFDSTRSLSSSLGWPKWLQAWKTAAFRLLAWAAMPQPSPGSSARGSGLTELISPAPTISMRASGSWIRRTPPFLRSAPRTSRRSTATATRWSCTTRRSITSRSTARQLRQSTTTASSPLALSLTETLKPTSQTTCSWARATAPRTCRTFQPAVRSSTRAARPVSRR